MCSEVSEDAIVLQNASEATTHHQLSEAGRVMMNCIQSLIELWSYVLAVKEMWCLVFSCVYYHTEMCIYTHLCIQITQQCMQMYQMYTRAETNILEEPNM